MNTQRGRSEHCRGGDGGGGGTEGETGERQGRDRGETGEGADSHTDAAHSGGRALVDTRADDGGTKRGPWRVSVSKISREVGVY